MTPHGKNDIRCAVCGAEFNSRTVRETKVKTCPNCTTTHQPVKIAEDVWIKLNWQDVRVLAIYAQRWGATFDKKNIGNLYAVMALEKIIRDLYRFKPEGGENLNASIDAPEIAEYIKVNTIKGIPSPFFKRLPPEDGRVH